MRLLITILSLIAFVSCKDVEKNPSGCSWGTMDEGNGLCVRSGYRAQKIIQKVEKSLFLKKFFFKDVDPYYTDYEIYYLDKLKLQKDLNHKAHSQQYIVLKNTLIKHLEMYRLDLTKIEEIYEQGDTDGVYAKRYLLEEIISDLEMMLSKMKEGNFENLEVNFDYLSEEKQIAVAKAYDEMIEDIKVKTELQHIEFGSYQLIERSSRTDGYSFDMDIKYAFNSNKVEVSDRIKDGLERYFLTLEVCQDDQLQFCLEDYYLEIEQKAPQFYYYYLK